MIGILKTDGGSRGNPGIGASGALLFDDNNKLIDFNGKYFKFTTNNNAEYQALVIGLKLAIKNNINDITCYLDSELIVKQMNGEYKISDSNIKEIKKEIDNLLPNFSNIKFIHIPREENKLADKLVNLILDQQNNDI